uniref:Ribonuclease H-like domain-containing protein n=1 Tax=Tanacetum cinerariifolium TaxID=118510 RepID=A0A6L2J3P7_TANCI|nr:ribonuclease H-like domain-containing protein [Tanacetum cinerariifolium]
MLTQTTTAEGGAITTTISSLGTDEEKLKKKNDVKARSMLLMALPNEHLMTFNQYKDSKSLFAAIETRFGGNEATKKTRKTLLKKIYKNFSAPSTESFDSIFNMLQKIVSQLAVLVSTASTQSSTASTQFSIATSQTSTANLSDATVYAFLANQSNGSQLVHEDLEQIHEDDLEEMGLKWQLALLSMRAKSYETLKKQYDDLKLNFNKAEFDLVVYKKGLAFVEEQLVFYKNNETTLCKNIDVLTKDMSIKDSKINMLKSELEKTKQEKEGIQFKIENFDNAFKSLDKLLGSQITDKSKNNLGFQSYNDVSFPATLVYNTRRRAHPKTDLSYYGLEEFKQPEFESYGPKSCEIESNNASEDIPNELKEYHDAPFVKDRVSDNKDCSVKSPIMVEKKTVVPTIARVEVVRPKQQEKPVRKTVRLATITIKGKGWPRAVNTARPNSTVVNAVRANQISRNSIEDMLPLGEEQMVAELLLESGTSTSLLKFPAIKQLAINWWDEYGFVIHPVLAPSQSALFPTSYFSPFIIPKDFYTNLVGIPG